MNPELDMGQAEGGFIMGMGYHLTEEVVYDTNTGEIINAGTWVRLHVVVQKKITMHQKVL